MQVLRAEGRLWVREFREHGEPGDHFGARRLDGRSGEIKEKGNERAGMFVHERGDPPEC